MDCLSSDIAKRTSKYINCFILSVQFSSGSRNLSGGAPNDSHNFILFWLVLIEARGPGLQAPPWIRYCNLFNFPKINELCTPLYYIWSICLHGWVMFIIITPDIFYPKSAKEWKIPPMGDMFFGDSWLWMGPNCFLFYHWNWTILGLYLYLIHDLDLICLYVITAEITRNKYNPMVVRVWW